MILLFKICKGMLRGLLPQYVAKQFQQFLFFSSCRFEGGSQMSLGCFLLFRNQPVSQITSASSSCHKFHHQVIFRLSRRLMVFQLSI